MRGFQLLCTHLYPFYCLHGPLAERIQFYLGGAERGYKTILFLCDYDASGPFLPIPELFAGIPDDKV